ncbi:hypothetical protein PM082_021510 [Marasmius tenuissimus]|nr:hypothetical protein PM082_021510 [Marasmius tenuissimus]
MLSANLSVDSACSIEKRHRLPVAPGVPAQGSLELRAGNSLGVDGRAHLARLENFHPDDGGGVSCGTVENNLELRNLAVSVGIPDKAPLFNVHVIGGRGEREVGSTVECCNMLSTTVPTIAESKSNSRLNLRY